jgi:hypothetical protein
MLYFFYLPKYCLNFYICIESVNLDWAAERLLFLLLLSEKLADLWRLQKHLSS